MRIKFLQDCELSGINIADNRKVNSKFVKDSTLAITRFQYVDDKVTDIYTVTLDNFKKVPKEVFTIMTDECIVNPRRK